MFGFGMSSRDKWHLNQAEILMSPIAKLMEQDEKVLARQLFDVTKDEVVKHMGENAYAENLGDKIVATKKEVVEKRQAAGLSTEDIRSHWNMTPLMQNLQSKMMEMSDFMTLNMAQQMGKNTDELQAIAAGWRKTQPRWGDPEQWNPETPVNKGFSTKDADIYIEFYKRVNRWRAETSETAQKALLENFNSYNAMLRDLISKKVI